VDGKFSGQAPVWFQGFVLYCMSVEPMTFITIRVDLLLGGKSTWYTNKETFLTKQLKVLLHKVSVDVLVFWAVTPCGAVTASNYKSSRLSYPEDQLDIS
jgi:hypothetical protein